MFSDILNGYCTKIKKRLYRDYIPSDLIVVCCLNPLMGMVAILICTADLIPLLISLYAVLAASLKREMILNRFGPKYVI